MTKWITRERPKIDRIACPWLIRRFVEADAEFIYVPTERVFAVAQEGSDDTFTVVLSLTPLRRIMKDYFVVCETYYQAIRTAPPSRIQSIDMGRRALHDDGSRVLVERLKGKITVDRDTARRLFTLICALHWKG